MSTTLTKPEPRAPRILDPFRMAREEFESLWSRLVGEPGERHFQRPDAALTRSVRDAYHD